jgi:acyl-coenzyme A synthetase/AMP-(fatty) acid ligase
MITIHDRIKEMIKVKGVQVAPAELEDLLLGHEKVEDVAVIGVPDEYAGELPFAYVALKPQITNTKEVRDEIVQYVQEKKSRNKWLGGIEIIDSVPKSPSGKILRRVLRKDFKAEWMQPIPKL